jgi:hypothetical protein
MDRPKCFKTLTLTHRIYALPSWAISNSDPDQDAAHEFREAPVIRARKTVLDSHQIDCAGSKLRK